MLGKKKKKNLVDTISHVPTLAQWAHLCREPGLFFWACKRSVSAFRCDVLCMRMTAHAKCQRGHLIWLVENEPCDVQTKICYPLEGSHHCQQAKRSKLLISCVWNEARARLEHRPFFAHTSNPLHYQPLRCRLPVSLVTVPLCPQGSAPRPGRGG